MNKKLRIITLAVAVIFSSNLVVLAENRSSLQERIDTNQNDINNLQDKKDQVNDEINNQNNELQSILSGIDEKSKDLEKAKAEANVYQAKIDEIQNEIDNISNEIMLTENDITIRENLIIQKEEEEERSKEALDQRMRSYYKMDINSNYIYMILKSQDIVSLFNNIQNIFRLVNLDKNLIKEVKEIQKQLEDEKTELSKKLEEIESHKTEILAKKDELKEDQKEFIAKQELQQSKMDELYALESQKLNIISSLSDEENELEGQIGDLLVYNEELEQTLEGIFAEINNSNNSITTDITSTNNSQDSTEESDKPLEDNSGESIVVGDPNNETFLRPGYGPVTDDYGPRNNPVTGEQGFHKGVDLGDSYGSPVAASKSGVVSYSGWISGYGNTIIIDHGNGVQTLYAHNSELVVGVGQRVGRGETISYVGSTGQSTGPHIHWEIRVNGQHINPMGYV